MPTRDSAHPPAGPEVADQGWDPRSTLSNDTALQLLLSTNLNSAAGTSDAAYIFSLFGSPCGVHAQINLLTAIRVLKRTSPMFPMVAMLGDACSQEATLQRLLADLGVTTEHVPEIPDVRCNGRRFGPNSRPLAPNANTSYFDATYTILSAWNLTRYRAVMVLDSDLAVMRSLDHVLLAMLARPEIAEARTPTGCLDAVASHPWRGNYFNTGV